MEGVQSTTSSPNQGRKKWLIPLRCVSVLGEYSLDCIQMDGRGGHKYTPSNQRAEVVHSEVSWQQSSLVTRTQFQTMVYQVLTKWV